MSAQSTDLPTATTLRLEIPGYVAGTWSIDPVHSQVSFVARHMMVAKVRGQFRNFSGQIVTGEDPLSSRVEAEIEVASVDTGNPDRDNHLRTSDFFDIEANPNMTFRSTGLRPEGDHFALDGALAINGVTRPVSLRLEVDGFGPDAYGGTRAGFTATGEISRKDFSVNFNPVMDSGGFVVGDKVQIQLEIEAVLQQ